MEVAAVHRHPLRGQPGDIDGLEPPVAVLHGRGALVAPGDVAHGGEQGDSIGLDLHDLRVAPPRAGLVGAVRDVHPGLEETPHQERARGNGLDHARDALVDPADHRGDHHHDGHADGDAENRQRRPPLVAAQRIERDADAFEQRPSGHVSCRRAAIGSSRAARVAGYTPATIPTPPPRATPTRIDQGATAAGSGVSAAPAPASPMPRTTPPEAPAVASVVASTRNCRRMSRRRAPSDLRIPISRVRSATAISMMFMMTMPPTTRAMSTSPGPTASRMRLILPQKSSTPSEVSRTKLSSWCGRRCRRLRMMPSTWPIASRISTSERAFTISASITPGGFTSRWIGETAGAITNLSSEMPSRLPRRSATPMTR